MSDSQMAWNARLTAWGNASSTCIIVAMEDSAQSFLLPKFDFLTTKYEKSILRCLQMFHSHNGAKNRALTLERIKCAYFGIPGVTLFANTDLINFKHHFPT